MVPHTDLAEGASTGRHENLPHDRVRVMHVYKFLYDGGTERYMHTLVTRMDPSRYDFSLCCLVEPGPGAEKFRRDGFPIFTLAVRRGGGVRYLAWNLWQIVRLARLLRRREIQIVHTHDNYPAAFARVAAWLARTPIVFVSYHNVYEWLTPLQHRVNRWLAQVTTRIICVSETVKRRSRSLDNIPEEKYRVIYNGIETARRENQRELRARYRAELGVPADAQVIGNVATLSRRKGQAHLVEAFGRLGRRFPRAYLVIVGSSRQEEPEVRPELDAIAKRYGVEDRVVFAGSREDVLDLIHMFDIYAMPSVIEGFGLSLVEAMSADVPAVVSDIAVFRELTENGAFARIARAADAEDLARQLTDGLEHPEAMRELGERAGRYARSRMSVEQMISRYEDLYQSELLAAGLIATGETASAFRAR